MRYCFEFPRLHVAFCLDMISYVPHLHCATPTITCSFQRLSHMLPSNLSPLSSFPPLLATLHWTPLTFAYWFTSLLVLAI